MVRGFLLVISKTTICLEIMIPFDGVVVNAINLLMFMLFCRNIDVSIAF